MTDKNLATTQNVVRFKQAFNQFSKNWIIPKRLDDNGKWQPIDHDRLVKEGAITKRDGYQFALWRMHKRMKSIVDDYKRPVWNVTDISKKWVTYNGITYSIFRFDCHRVFHGIVGGMSTVGRAGATK
jgi:hypothetical protein